MDQDTSKWRELPEGTKLVVEELSGKCELLVDFGVEVLDKCAKTRVEGEQFIPLMMLYRYGLELIDSISILIKQCSIDPCFALLRTALETQLSIEWMTADRFEERAKTYMVFRAYQDLRRMDQLETATDVGRQHLAKLRKDPVMLGMDFSTYEFDKFRQIKNNIINSASNRIVQAEFQRVNKLPKKDRPKNWYSYFPSDGKAAPGNLEQLADQLNRQAFYDFLYREWSQSTHATNVITGRLSNRNSFYHLRFPKNVKQVSLYSLLIGTGMTNSVIKVFAPSYFPEARAWYEQNLQPTIVQLSGDPVVLIKNQTEDIDSNEEQEFLHRI